jgi:hypothetical protein
MTNLDRPDVVKSNADPFLRFKDSKLVLYKFLYLCNIPFKHDIKLNLASKFTVKKGKNTIDELELKSHNSYIVTAQLNSFKVDNKPVYLLILPTSYAYLDNRHRARISVLRSQYNVVIFDIGDLNTIGVVNHSNQWFEALGKPALKKWVKLLFSKIAELGLKVETNTTLTKIHSHIDDPAHLSNNQTIKSLNNKAVQLETKLVKHNLQHYKSCNLDYILKEYLSIPQSTRKWYTEVAEGFISTLNQDCPVTDKIFNNVTVLRLKGDVFRLINRDTFESIMLSVHTTKSEKMPHRLPKINLKTGLLLSVFVNKNNEPISYKISRYSKGSMIGYLELKDLKELCFDY